MIARWLVAIAAATAILSRWVSDGPMATGHRVERVTVTTYDADGGATEIRVWRCLFCSDGWIGPVPADDECVPRPAFTA
jgi:hypothetical protein